MGRHGSPDSDIAAGAAPRAWDAGSWEAAIAPGSEDSLYATGAQEAWQAGAAHDSYYEPVNGWSGVYTTPSADLYSSYDQPAAQSGFYDYESHGYQQPQAQAQPMYEAYQQPQAQTYQQQPQQPDQSYYESVYAAYAQQATPPPAAAPATPTWDGPEWQDPYAPQASFYGEPQGYAQPGYGQQPGYEQYQQAYEPPQGHAGYDGYAESQLNFHDPSFDTGEFEKVYAGPGSTEAEYDMLADDEHGNGEQGYAESGYDEYEEYEYDLDYDEEVPYSGGEYDEDEEEAPVRSRSRSGGSTGGPKRPGDRPGPRPMAAAAKRRTLSTITSTPAAVVGVAAVAVAAVGGLRLPGHTETASAEAQPPSSGLEQNLLQMRAASANLANRASRDEMRGELSQQQALERQRLAEMAPRYFLPVDGPYALTAGFGDAGARWASLHTGQDFAVAEGTRVIAVADGTVTETGWAGAFGNRIVITHTDGSQTWYCHLSVIKVKSGPVKAGQLIAYSGDTGNSTGPHLHFEYHPPGTPDPMNGVPGATTAVDPMPFLHSHGLLP